MEITITGQISVDKLPLAKECFLKEHPMPLNEDGTDKHTFVEWLSICVWRCVRGEIIQGKKSIDAEALDMDNIIV